MSKFITHFIPLEIPLSPPLSIVIPHLNEPAQLEKCLAAIAKQQSTNIPCEVIVVDNGSTQLPAAICGAFHGVQLLSQTVPGPGPARNLGAEHATAPLLAFVDADCTPGRGWLRAVVDFMDRNPDVDFIGGDILIRPVRPERLTPAEAYESVFSYRARYYIEHHGFAATGNMAVRATAFRQIGHFGGIGTMEDTEWGKRATALGYRSAFVAEARVFTPPCKSFDEVIVRWNRHIAHEYRQLRGHPGKILIWLARAALIAASPIGDVYKCLRSDRISGTRNRSLSFAYMASVRLYRAGRMLTLVVRDDTPAMLGSWNRENGLPPSS